jgi:hypothetical protein
MEFGIKLAVFFTASLFLAVFSLHRSAFMEQNNSSVHCLKHLVAQSRNNYAVVELIYSRIATDEIVQKCKNYNRSNLMLFAREFYVPNNQTRLEEIKRAIRETHLANLHCSCWVLVVQSHEYQEEIIELANAYDIPLRIWISWGTMTVKSIYESIMYTKEMMASEIVDERNILKNSIFVASTADVAISDLEKRLINPCSSAFNGQVNNSFPIFIVSRREPEQRNCRFYERQGSFDVFIGSTEVISKNMLSRLIFSPTYWGTENVIGYVLSKAANVTTVYQVCKFVDVVHYHSYRETQEDNSRIRILHRMNSIAGGKFPPKSVCSGLG